MLKFSLDSKIKVDLLCTAKINHYLCKENRDHVNNLTKQSYNNSTKTKIEKVLMKETIMKSVLAVLVALCSLNVYAYDVEIDGIYYNLYPEYEMAEVTTGDAKYTGDIVIPESFEHDGITYTVKYIVNAFYRCGDITSIIIPNSITSIESMSFLYCTSLTSVTIPGSVTSIESSAFYGCTSLTSITIPNGVTSIGDRAFYDCSNLASVDISNSVTSIGRECFVGTPWYENLEDGVIYINDVLYKYKGTMPADTSITIKEGTVSISPEAFLFCDNLTSVIIPNSVRTIYDQAFGNSGLTEIYCYATPVPETDASAFNMVTTFFVTLHVPSASWDAYKEAFPWNAFNSIVALYEENAIEDVKVADGNYQIYTIDGRPASTLQKGVNVLRMKDGTVKKVFVK